MEVIVLAPYGAGGTIVSDLLSRIGVDMGYSLPPITNKVMREYGRSLFEDRYFVAMNKHILEQAGGNWFKPPSKEDIVKTTAQTRPAIRKIVLSRKHKSLWGWKNSMTSLTAPLYHEFLSDPMYVIVRRDIKTIALTYAFEEISDVEQATILVSAYYKHIDTFLCSSPRFSIDIEFDKLVESENSAKLELRQLVGFLDLSIKSVENIVSVIDFKERNALSEGTTTDIK